MADHTIRELQSSLPWTGHYHRDFRATPMTHKDFQHGLLHVHKAGGKLATIINDAEHGGVAWNDYHVRDEVTKYLADFVICALRMANTCPEGIIFAGIPDEDNPDHPSQMFRAAATEIEKLRAVIAGITEGFHG